MVSSGDDARRAQVASFERWYLRALLALARRDHAEATIVALAPRLEAIEQELATLARVEPVRVLCDRLALDPIASDLLAAATAFAGDPRMPMHAEALGGPLARRGLSVAVFAEIAQLSAAEGQELVSRLAFDHPLFDFGLLAVGDELATPAARPYTVAPRLLRHVVGDDTCPGVLRVHEPEPGWLYDPSQKQALDELRQGTMAMGAPLVVLEGRRDSGRRSAVARVTERGVVVLDAEGLAVATFVAAIRTLQREAFLRDTVAVIVDPPRPERDGDARELGHVIERFAGRVVVATTRPDLELAKARPTIRVRWPIPDVACRRSLWVAYGTRDGDPPDGDVDLLAMRYRVGPGAIARAVTSAGGVHEGRLDADLLAAGLRHNIGERMSGLAQRIPVTQRWDDVVLADDIRDQVQALVARVKHGHKVLEQWGYREKMARGAGVAALFSGPPGTGKTMVAGLIARELELELYQVDLSQVVSKWVGETEKQLARVFDGAEEGHALLLFDEADALFGQRTSEVRGAVDRYANLEVNFLLQRIESFGGITVLTTNLDASIDRAVKRRLAAHIVFAMPDEEERAALWRRLAKTATAPLSPGIDFDGLAREFPAMSGANIRNAAFSAAFMAAADGAQAIGQEHFIRAGRAEYRSMGHVLAERGVGRAIAR